MERRLTGGVDAAENQTRLPTISVSIALPGCLAFDRVEMFDEHVDERTWPFRSFDLASRTGNHAARSTSGKDCIAPELVATPARVVARDLRHVEVAPDSPRDDPLATRCRSSPSLTRRPSGGRLPSSSSNSRSAAARGSGSTAGSYSPLGIDHAPSSLFAQNGHRGGHEHFQRAGGSEPIGEQSPRCTWHSTNCPTPRGLGVLRGQRSC